MNDRVILDNGRIVLLHGDCLEILPKVKPACVDMVFADLPYGTTQNKWDSIIPLDQLWLLLNRCGQLNVVHVMTSAQPFTTILNASNLAAFKYDIIWNKVQVTNFLNSKRQPLRQHEHISVFYTAQPTYIPQMGIGTPYKIKRTHATDNYGTQRDNETDNAGIRHPTTCITFPQSRKTVHPTQKPVELLEYLIKTYTNKNDVVLDPTMGSGTTGVACVNHDRRFIGIEKDRTYFELAVKRIQEAINDKTCQS